MSANVRAVSIVFAIAALALVIFARSGVATRLMPAAPWKQRERRTVLRVWDWWSPATDEKYAKYFSDVKREFEQAHPDVELVFQYVPFGQYEQKMATALSGESPPDVFQASVAFAEGLYDRGMLRPLNSYMQRELADRERRQRLGLPIDTGQIIDRDALLESAWRHNTKPDGTVFGIPQILDADCLVWNLDILRKYTADPEICAMFETRPDGSPDLEHLRFEAVRDWDQFRRIARKLTRYGPDGRAALDPSGQPIQAGFAIHAHGDSGGAFMPWLASNGANFQDDAGTRSTFAGPEGVQAMQQVLDLYWKDGVSPPFRRQLSDEEVFNAGHVACSINGTWSGKYITRATEGRLRFDLTAFPAGPMGHGQATVAWGNVLVISAKSKHSDLAWEYIKFIASLPGALRLLRDIEQNSPRKDFYRTPYWQQMCQAHPYLHNIPSICAVGKKLRNTQSAAVNYVTQPVFETILLRYPQIAAGRGPYPSVQAALSQAASAAQRVYDRYNAQVAEWKQTRAVARGNVPP